MAMPKVIMLLLIGTIVYSYVTKAESYEPIDRLLPVLQQKCQNPMDIQEIIFTFQLGADPTCTLDSLRKAVMPLVILLEQAPADEEQLPAWFASLGSPFRELMMGAGEGKNIHGLISGHIDVEKLFATLSIVVHRTESCDEKVWSSIVHDCIDLITRCSSGAGCACMACMARPFQEVVTIAEEMTNIHVKMGMEFKVRDAERITIPCMGNK